MFDGITVVFAEQADIALMVCRKYPREGEATPAWTAGYYLPAPFLPLSLLCSGCSNFWTEASFEVQSSSDSLLCFGQQVNKWALPREAVIPPNTGLKFLPGQYTAYTALLHIEVWRLKGKGWETFALQSLKQGGGGVKRKLIPDGTGIPKSNGSCQIEKGCLSRSIINCRPL